MYQVAFGGFVTDGVATFYDSPNSYYEPSWNTLTPHTFYIPKCDTAYFIFRKRTNQAGTTFGTPEVADASISVKDVTTGESVPVALTTNTINVGWVYNVAVAAVTINIEDLRVRNIEVLYTDHVTKQSVTFQAKVSDSDRILNSLIVKDEEYEKRPTASTSGNSIDLELTNSSAYILVSPFAFLESDATGDFSYPLQRIYYAQDQTYNLEDLTYSIANLSDVSLNNIVRVNKTDNRSVGVVVIDAYAAKTLEEVGSEFTFDVLSSTLSGNTDTLSVRLYKRNRLFMAD